MANQTVTTALNYDDASISGLLNGESITINGGSVTFNADVRWNQQAAVFGDMTISATLGGSLIFDGTQIWEVPFSASTANVPTQNALGSNGVTGGTSGATGELTRVWATGSLTPSAAGGAMPATGYIKLRSKTGNFQTGETITLPGGATITASSAGKRSWIHLVGRGVTSGTGSRTTAPRLGSLVANGDWYELGTTNGADNQTIQYPVSDFCPAVWIETAENSGVYEIWLNASGRWANGNMSTTDKRGMYFHSNPTTGVLTFAARGATVAGFKPATNCKIRIPNIILSNANGSTAAWDTNFVPTSTSAKYGISSFAGVFDVNNIVYGWFSNIVPPYSVRIRNSAIGDTFNCNTCATSVEFTNTAVGFVSSAFVLALNLQINYGSTTITDCRMARFAGNNGAQVVAITTSNNVTITRLRADSFCQETTNIPAGVVNVINLSQIRGLVLNDITTIGGTALRVNNVVDGTVSNIKFCNQIVGTTGNNQSFYSCVDFSAECISVIVDGITFFENLSNLHPFNGIGVLTAVRNCEMRNVGTLNAPLNLGPTNPSAQVFSSASGAQGVTLRRIYTDHATRLWLGNSATRTVEAYNLWSNAAAAENFLGNNMTFRGGRHTFAAAGTSAVYGTHWIDAFQSTTAGIITVLCNEPTTDTTAQCTATLSSASGSGFTATGSVSMKSLTDVVEWTMPYYCLGITGFANSAPTVNGTNTGNHTLDFQYDLGTGVYNGTWLALTGANLSAITVSPTVGVKLKIRATVNTANTGNLLTNIRVATVTNATAYQTQYPLPGSILNVTNLITNSRVKVTRVDTGVVLAQQGNGAASSVQFDLQYAGAVLVEARNASNSPAYQPWVTQTNISTSTPVTVIALQITD